MPAAALELHSVRHAYGTHLAVEDVSFDVQPGELCGLLGPNGGGKSTLFRLIATLLPIQAGTIRLFDVEAATAPAMVRRMLGVTFQSPSLDRQLTVRENLLLHAELYGLTLAEARERGARLAAQLGLEKRLHERVRTLSGGLQRRVELAKCLLPSPRFLLLDEPTTGLDPGVRREFWETLRQLRDEQGVTLLVTTHLLDEADECDRLVLVDRGRVVAWDTPEVLRAGVGGATLTVHSLQVQRLAEWIRSRWSVMPLVSGNTLHVQHSAAQAILQQLLAEFPGDVASLSLAPPTLADVFEQRTGKSFQEQPAVQ